MDTYSLLRQFADSWVLLAMFTFFVGVILWAYLPSQRPARDAAASIPFRDDATGCAKDCASCTCTKDVLKGADHG